MKKLHFILPLFLLFSTPVYAKTLILDGELDGIVVLKQQVGFAVDKPVETLSFHFALPATFKNRGVTQEVRSLSLKFEPKPETVEDETDRFGNNFKKVTWRRLKQDASIHLEFEARVRSALSAMTSEAPFPLPKLPKSEQLFLKKSPMAQSDQADIVNLAKSLTDGARTEYQAVNAILNFVADNIKYAYNPDKYDAQYTLANRSGNCQNFAHLSMALLRAAGIPSRIVGGISLKDQWKVPVNNQNSVVQGMGQGGHAWMEIYFPDLGWLSYDPQQSRQFTSTRHIKQTHGLDSTDINDSWSAAPYLPGYSELIDAKYLEDRIDVRLTGSEVDPRPYLVSNSVKMAKVAEPQPPALPVETTKPLPVQPQVTTEPVKPVTAVVPSPAPLVAPPLPIAPAKPVTEIPVLAPPPAPVAEIPVPVAPPKPVAKPPKPVAVLPPVVPPSPLPVIEKPLPAIIKPEEKKPVLPPLVKPKPVKNPDSVNVVEFGNMVFPNLVDSFRVSGMNGTRVFDKETSEYVTSTHVFAQAVFFESDSSLEKISLAMHKFGGDGSLFLDFVADDNGKPSLDGIRSNPVFLDTISRKPGYYWIDFKYNDAASKPQIKKGKYWMVLRHSGDAIVNWFYIPGKPYSKGDDTRSTAKGYLWEDILSYDFVFKVSGRVKSEE